MLSCDEIGPDFCLSISGALCHLCIRSFNMTTSKERRTMPIITPMQRRIMTNPLVRAADILPASSLRCLVPGYWSGVMVLDLSNVTSDGRTEYCRAPYTLPRLSKGRMMVINLWSLGWDLSMKECKLVMFSRRFAFKHGIMIPPFPWMYWWVTYELCKFVSQSLTIMVEFMNHWCKTLIF